MIGAVGTQSKTSALERSQRTFWGKEVPAVNVGGNQEFFQQGTWMAEERGLRRAVQWGGTLLDVIPNCFSNRRSQASWETC